MTKSNRENLNAHRKGNNTHEAVKKKSHTTVDNPEGKAALEDALKHLHALQQTKDAFANLLECTERLSAIKPQGYKSDLRDLTHEPLAGRTSLLTDLIHSINTSQLHTHLEKLAMIDAHSLLQKSLFRVSLEELWQQWSKKFRKEPEPFWGCEEEQLEIINLLSNLADCLSTADDNRDTDDVQSFLSCHPDDQLARIVISILVIDNPGIRGVGYWHDDFSSFKYQLNKIYQQHLSQKQSLADERVQMLFRNNVFKILKALTIQNDQLNQRLDDALLEQPHSTGSKISEAPIMEGSGNDSIIQSVQHVVSESDQCKQRLYMVPQTKGGQTLQPLRMDSLLSFLSPYNNIKDPCLQSDRNDILKL